MNLHLMEACMILAAARKLVAVGDHDRKVESPKDKNRNASPGAKRKAQLRESAGRALTLAG